MTWEKEHSYLRFICRVTDENMPVILFDSQGNKYEDHTLNDQLYNRKTQESLFHLTNIHEIVFTIDISQKTNVDGIWLCCQGDETFQTEVSVAAGIISATSIRIVGTLIHNFQNSKVKLECFSCREPYGNNVEFLINQQSEDMITFDKDTETCMHITGNCHPSECACSSSGNEFIRIFPVNDVQSTLYSCSMQFTDIDKGSVFIKLASIYFNGTGKYPASFPDIYDTVDKDDEKLLLDALLVKRVGIEQNNVAERKDALSVLTKGTREQPITLNLLNVNCSGSHI
ncbi:Hypothetical predicted protein [Mytilus galloprovincialis]|uniref:Uncharacterized protein n=1 Tax=Mytilus galloprovincialis TaxID=29158 RepID=A0A8B6H074_MYTGA|nr:Hypothetical predicted protein [Mytilus galloprovincialis]